MEAIKINGLPVYEAEVGEAEDSNLEMKYIALVDRPAIERGFLAFRNEGATKVCSLELTASEAGGRRIVSGPVMLADTPIYRRGKDSGGFYVLYRKDAIFKMAQQFFRKGYQANVNAEHNRAAHLDGLVVFESFITDAARGIAPMRGYEDAPDGSWFVSMHVENDRVWEAVQAGRFNGFSLEGLFRLTPAEPAETEPAVAENRMAAMLAAAQQFIQNLED